MMSTGAYLTAIALYWVAALVGVILMNRLWFRQWRGRAGGIWAGAIAGVLLVPAFPAKDVDTVAPALVVTLFNALFGEGLESALMPALWLLGGTLVGMVIGRRVFRARGDW